MKKLLAALLAAVMFTALVTGCANDGGTPATTPDGSSSGSTTPAPGNTGAQASSPPSGNGELRTVARYPISGEITTFIGGDNNSTNNTIPISITHDRFIINMPDGSIAPAVCSAWDISADGMTYTFTIRDDVVFHDGTPMTVEDVAWSLNLFRDGTNMTATVGAYVDRAEVVDESTVRMFMKSPYAPILIMMARDGYLYSKNHFEVTCGGSKDVFQMNPCGSGPYKVVEYKGGEGLYLEANENYWDDEWRGKIIPKAELRIITDTNAIQTALETDSLDFAGVAINVPDTSYDAFRANPEFLVTTGGSTMTFYCPINTKVWDNQTVRQALAHALDRDFLIELLDAGNGEIANTLAGKKSFGWTEQKPYDYDIERAKELLKEAGHENGAGLPEMHIVARPDRKTGCEALQSMWNEIGISSRVDVQEATTYLAEIRKGNYGTSVISQTVALDIGGTINDFSDPSNGSNQTFWYEPDVWALLDAANATVDEAKRMEYYQDAFTQIREVVNHIYLFYDTKLYVHRANLALGSTYAEPPALRFYECSWLPDGETVPEYNPIQR